MKTQNQMEEIWEKAVINCGTYIICSTLNQAVNYLPYKMIKRKQGKKRISIKNITYMGNDQENATFVQPRFLNQAWDGNFREAAEKVDIQGEDKICNIDLQRSFNQGDYRESICKALQKEVMQKEGNTFLWNLTGGQRTVLFAVQDFIEQDLKKQEQEKDSGSKRNHVIFYLEGNTQRIIMGICEQNQWEYAELHASYEDPELTIPVLFSLSGFIAEPEEEYFFDKGNWVIKKKHKCTEDFAEKRTCAYLELFKVFKEKKEDLLKKMVETNKESQDAKKEFIKILDEVEGIEKSKIDCIKKSLENRTTKPFGYFLEFMALAVIIKEIQEGERLKNYRHLFRSVGFDVSVKKSTKKKEFCQLDLVLTLKSGQAVFFECKSGSMSSETGKAREYTAYVLGGVYGKPILITPFGHSDITDRIKDKDFKQINDAIKAAGRAGLDVCCLDNLAEDLTVVLKPLFDSQLRG